MQASAEVAPESIGTAASDAMSLSTLVDVRQLMKACASGRMPRSGRKRRIRIVATSR